MVRSRLAAKIGLVIVVVLIIGFGASTVVTIQRESAALVEQNKIAARRLTATLVASIEGAMLQGRPDVTRQMLQELKTSSPVEGFTVYRRNGVEAFTDLATATEVAKTGNLPREVLETLARMQRAPGAPTSGPDFTRALETVTTQETLETRDRSEEHTSELQSPTNLVCRLLLEKKKK